MSKVKQEVVKSNATVGTYGINVQINVVAFKFSADTLHTTVFNLVCTDQFIATNNIPNTIIEEVINNIVEDLANNMVENIDHPYAAANCDFSTAAKQLVIKSFRALEIDRRDAVLEHKKLLKDFIKIEEDLFTVK